MKFPGDYGLKNWLRQSLSHTDIIPNLLFNYNQLIQKLKSDPVMYKFNQLCIGKALDTVGNSLWIIIPSGLIMVFLSLREKRGRRVYTRLSL